MKKILAITILFAGTLFVSCKKNIDSLNKDVKNPSEVPAGSLFTGAVKSLADNMTTPNVNVGIFRLLAQQWAETTYPDETQYDLSTRNITQNFWDVMYRDVLKPLDEAAKLVPGQDPKYISPETIKNESALIEIVNVYTYSILVETYGNVPYSKALDINDVTPEFDDAATVYKDLLSRLDAAIANLDVTAEGFGENDILFTDENGGEDMNKVLKFANSWKLRMGMMLADVDPTTASTVVEAAAPNVMQSNADNLDFKYLSAPPNTNPVWVNLVQSGRKDFVGANTLVDAMLAVNDPRVPFYFEPAPGGSDYIGGEYGTGNSYSNYSPPNTKITKPDFPSIILDYAEVEFLLAEAVERGFNVGGTAEGHYDNAITASIEYWGGGAADAATYLAQADVAYTTAPGTFKEKIGNQMWIALYNNGYEAWTQWRRLDAPALVAPAEALTAIPLRYTYPVQEQNLNVTNYNAASAAIGGDAVTTKIFWDIF